MQNFNFKKFLNLFKQAWDVFKENHPVKFASALAYFALFGLPSILLILIFILSFAFDINLLYDQLKDQLEAVVGEDASEILVTITSNYMDEARADIFSTAFYSITVFWLSTQLMIFFQDILNDLWRIKPNFKNFWQKMWKERGLSFIMVLITGFLFFASAAVELVLDLTVGNTLADGLQSTIVNIVMVLMVYFWFAILYKFLPLVEIKWGPTLVGAAITSILFFVGTWLLWEFAVKEKRLDDIYDHVAPIVLVAFWIFYTSLTFFYGASFTRVYAMMQDKQIKPKSYAYKYEIVEK